MSNQLSLRLSVRTASLTLCAAALAPTAAAQVTFTNGVLAITGTPGNDDITLQVGPLPGEVEVQGVAGPVSGGTFFGVRGVSATLGAGQDKVQVLGSAPVLPRLDLDFGAGLADASVDFTFAASPAPLAASGIRIVTGDQDDVVNVLLKTNAGGTSVFLDLALGNGKNDVTTFVEPENTSSAVRVWTNFNGGSGEDIVTATVGGATPLAECVLTGNLGAGNDEAKVVLGAFASGQARLDATLDLGAGDDKFDLVSSDANTNVLGSVRTGDGQDTLELVSNRRFTGGILLDAGAGNDSVKLISTQPNDSASRILAGDGDDTVEVLRGSGTNQTPTTSDGGAGFDVFTGIGDVTNFEVVNR